MEEDQLFDIHAVGGSFKVKRKTLLIRCGMTAQC